MQRTPPKLLTRSRRRLTLSRRRLTLCRRRLSLPILGALLLALPLATGLLLAGCKAKRAPARSWGSLKVLQATPTLFFSGQPDVAALEAAKATGVVAVINLRAPSELKKLPFDEAKAVKKLGLTYVMATLDKPSKGPLDTAALEKISQTIGTFKGKKILVHCSSGNRVATWYGAHLVNHEKLSTQDAFAKALTLGLTKQGAKSALKAYLGI